MTSPFSPVLTEYFDAYARHDAAGCAATFTEDAQLVHPWGPPASGRAEIAAVHRDWFEEGETNKRWQITYEQVGTAQGSCQIRFSADMPGGSQVQGTTLCALEFLGGQWLMRIASLHPLSQSEDEDHDTND